ncbi:MAG TPA: PAS domain-containing protein, partial [Thermodesulfovibrionia bacterium]|nr:PAS domain-containing protein [Thermodesulfovibrionia bacterium]
VFLHGIIFAFLWLYEEIPLGAIANLLTVLAGIVVLFLFRFNGSIKITSYALSIIVNFNLLFKIWLTGGHGEYALYWNMIIPLYMTMINGLGAGILWAGIVVAEFSGYYVLVHLHIPFPELIQFESYRIIEYAASIALVFIVVLFSYFNETLMNQYISRLHQTQKVLKKGKERYAMATVAGGVGVWEWLPQSDSIYLDSHLRNMLGISDDEVIGGMDGWLKLVEPADVPDMKSKVDAVASGQEKSIEFYYRLVRRNGTNHWFLARAKAMEHESGKPSRILGTATDITNEKVAEEKLRIALKECEKQYAGYFKPA